MQTKNVELTGMIKHVLFTSADGYKVLVVKPSDKEDKKKINVCGLNLPDRVMFSYKFIGEYKNHPKYGETFNAIDAIPVLPDGNAEMEEYLSSGIFKGIGTTTAKKIVAHFKEQTKEIIEHTPDRLCEVKGISVKKAQSIAESIRSTTYVREVYDVLSAYGLKMDQCSKLVKKHKAETLTCIKRNPYCIMDDLSITFEAADQIAMEMGIDKESEIRLTAACNSVMGKVLLGGDTGCEAQQFGTGVYKELSMTVPCTVVENHIVKLITDRVYRSVKLTIDTQQRRYIFPGYMFDREKKIAEDLYRLAAEPVTERVKNLGNQIREYEENNGIEFDDIQKNAIKTALTNRVTVITGGPGTGKTTIEKAIISIYKKNMKKNVILLAPTGRASRRMTEATGHKASTIHSYLEIYDTEHTDELDVNAEKTTDALIIIDEMSMTDIKIMYLLLEKIGKGNHVVLIGDPDQLPSVGAGAVLRDILDAAPDLISVVKLERSYRLSNSTIYDNIYKVNNGSTENLKTDRHCRFLRAVDVEDAIETILNTYFEKVSEYGMTNTMLLLPYRKNELGVEALNARIQEIMNPSAQGKGELVLGKRVLRTGDMVMHVKSNTQAASNGDIGIIKAIEKDGGDYSVLVSINDELVTYTHDDIDCLDLAYAMTVHKSQGSEAKCVIFALTKEHPAMCYRNIPYVAMSRAKDELYIICDNSFVKAVKTFKRNTRLTLLPYFIKMTFGEFV